MCLKAYQTPEHCTKAVILTDRILQLWKVMTAATIFCCHNEREVNSRNAVFTHTLCWSRLRCPCSIQMNERGVFFSTQGSSQSERGFRFQDVVQGRDL